MTKWITVEDRLSELTVKAIWYNEHGDTIVGTYTKLGWTFSYYSGAPTHWKPDEWAKEKENENGRG